MHPTFSRAATTAGNELDEHEHDALDQAITSSLEQARRGLISPADEILETLRSFHSRLSYPPDVPEHVTIEELEAAMAAAVDADGNDVRLAEWVASMTDEERRESEENLRRWVEAARKSLRERGRSEPADEV